MTSLEWTQKAVADIKIALKEFGEYQFADKGANEVMEIPSLDGLSTKDAKAALLGVLDAKDIPPQFGGILVSDVLIEEQDREDFDDLLQEPRLGELF